MNNFLFSLHTRIFDQPRMAVGLGALFALTGCPTPAPVFMDEPDTGRVRRDGGPPPDAYVMDSGPTPDTGPRPDAFRPRDTGFDTRRDAPVDPITVDGRLSESAWLMAIDNTPFPTGGGPIFEGAHFDRFLHFRTATNLYFAYEGDFPETNTIVVFIDRDYGTDRGVLLTGVPLFDRVGPVDFVLSNAITSVDSEFRPDIAWGSSRRPEAATMASATLGWRTLSGMGNHSTITAGLSACTVRICETSIPLLSVGVDATTTLRFAMRVGDREQLDVWADGLTAPADEPALISATISILPLE